MNLEIKDIAEIDMLRNGLDELLSRWTQPAGLWGHSRDKGEYLAAQKEMAEDLKRRLLRVPSSV